MASDESNGDEVYRISGAGRSLSDDVSARTRRYLISMAARTICFIGCVVSFVVLKNAIVGWILFVIALRRGGDCQRQAPAHRAPSHHNPAGSAPILAAKFGLH